MPSNKLDIRQTLDGTAFYIDGSLQFDTRDEFIYHEMLVLPAAGILSLRKKGPFRALVLGGGDGLALREILKFDRLRRVDLIDYDPEVLRYGKEEFALWNKNAFHDKRVTVTVEEAGRYLRCCRKTFDLIVADFTFPDNLETSHLFTEEFYSLVRQHLSPAGIAAFNTVSPEMSAPAFWSIHKTLASLKMHPRPFRVPVPAFISQGYGEWGFFLSSPSPILCRELKGIKEAVPAQYFNTDIFLKGMQFPRRKVFCGMSLAKVLKEPPDLLGLLNMPLRISGEDRETVDFSRRFSAKDLRLMGLDPRLAASEFTPEWYERMAAVLRSLDWETFFDEVEKSIKGGFQKLSGDFKILRKELPELLREKVLCWENLHKLVALLVILIIFINTVFPDNAYAKGYYGGMHHGTGNQYSEGGITPVLLAPAAIAAFYGLGKDNFVPDVQGRKHSQKPVALAEESGTIRQEKAFFALADDIYVSENGEVWVALQELPFYYQVGDHGFTLFAENRETPIFEFAPDPQLMRLIAGNLDVQQKALDKTLSDYEKWLAWAQPAQFVSKGIRDEIQEVRKLKTLRGIFSDLRKKLSQRTLPEGEPVPEASLGLLPGIYLSKNRNLLLRKADGSVVTYPFRGFDAEAGIPIWVADENLTRFLETTIQWSLRRPKIPDSLRQILLDKMGQKNSREAAWN